MGRRDRRDQGSMLDRRYEGPEVLGRMLERARARVDAAGALRELALAIAQGRTPPEVIPSLFEGEPRFGGPEDALRLYGNLFGAWDLLQAGTDPAELLVPVPPPPPDPEELPPPPRPRLPPRGSVSGRRVPAAVIEATWQHLADLPARERTRRQDRHANLQPDLSEWARTAGDLSPVAGDTLSLLCFELAEMFDAAFGDRLGAVTWRALGAADPGDAAELQPDAVAYVAGSLDEAEDEDEQLPGSERADVESLARRAVVALTRAVRD